MKKFFVKSGTLSIVLTMLICAFSLTALAETYTGECGDNLTWTFDDSAGVLEISGTGPMQDCMVEDYADAITPWVSYTKSIKTVKIENGATTIEDGMFSFCSNLTSVTIPNSVTEIGEYAFFDCISLTNITIPGSVTTISESAFGDCSLLENVTICDGVTTIAEEAFSDSFNDAENPVCITIPASVTTIEDEAFYSTEISDVYYGGTETQWKAISIGKKNDDLTNANIHFSYTTAEIPNESTNLNGSNVTHENSTASEEETTGVKNDIFSDIFEGVLGMFAGLAFGSILLYFVSIIIIGTLILILTPLAIWILKKLFRLIKRVASMLYQKYKSK